MNIRRIVIKLDSDTEEYGFRDVDGRQPNRRRYHEAYLAERQ
jgi:hypothetical protein